MPIGKNNTDLNDTGITFENGIPITEPHEFGTPMILPHDFGNDIPVADPTKDSNPVTWPTPDPAHYGNIFAPVGVSGFELENGLGIILLESGGTLLLELQ